MVLGAAIGGRAFPSDLLHSQVTPPEQSRPRDQPEKDEKPVGHGELHLAGVGFPVHGLGKPGLSGDGGGFVGPKKISPPCAIGARPGDLDAAGGLPGAEMEALGHPEESIEMLLGPPPPPTEEDQDEDTEPEGFPAVEGAGKHRLKLWLPGCRSEALHPAVAPDEEGGPREEEKEDEEPVGDGSGRERVIGEFAPVDGPGEDGVAPRVQVDAGNGESRGDDSDDL